MYFLAPKAAAEVSGGDIAARCISIMRGGGGLGSKRDQMALKGRGGLTLRSKRSKWMMAASRRWKGRE